MEQNGGGGGGRIKQVGPGKPKRVREGPVENKIGTPCKENPKIKTCKGGEGEPAEGEIMK